jgi:HK97 family phage major capsid protein
MQTITLDKFKDALARAAAIKGEPGMIAQKKLILDGFMIVDAEGMAIDPETIDIHLMPAAPAVEEDAAQPQETNEMNSEEIKKSVRAAVAAEIAVKGASPVASAEPWKTAKVYGKLKHFTSNDRAWRFGTWCLAAMGHKKSAEYCAANGMGLRTKAHLEGVNSQGGFLVPDEFENELVTLREQYGVFRRNAKVYPMSSDTLRIAKRSSGLTAYFVGEANAITESTQVFDSNTLVAKKLAAITTVSNELLEDAVINIADDIAGEIAYAFAQKEDDCGFNGDGTSTYGGIVGLANSLTDATYQVSDGTASTCAGVALADINKGLGKLPAWAYQRNNVKIYCHKSVYHTVFERHTMAAGGVTAAEIAAGAQPRFFGYPVEFAQVLPTQAAADIIGGGATFAYIGDLAQGCYFGDRRSTSIAFSDSALNAFEQDERVARGTERFDIVCANVGSSSAAGAVIKLTL